MNVRGVRERRSRDRSESIGYPLSSDSKLRGAGDSRCSDHGGPKEHRSDLQQRALLALLKSLQQTRPGGVTEKWDPVRAAQVSQLIESGWRTSQPPSHQSSLNTRRVILDPVHGLPGQAGLFGDLSDAHGLLA